MAAFYTISKLSLHSWLDLIFTTNDKGIQSLGMSSFENTAWSSGNIAWDLLLIIEGPVAEIGETVYSFYLESEKIQN